MNTLFQVTLAIAWPLSVCLFLVWLGFTISEYDTTKDDVSFKASNNGGNHCLLLAALSPYQTDLPVVLSGVTLFFLFAGIVPFGMIWLTRQTHFPRYNHKPDKIPSNLGSWDGLEGRNNNQEVAFVDSTVTESLGKIQR